MEITLKFDNLREMKETIDTLFVLFPEEEKLTMNDIHTLQDLPEGKLVGGGSAENAAQVAKRIKADRDEILRMKKDGMTARAISKATGSAYSTVCRVIQEAKKK